MNMKTFIDFDSVHVQALEHNSIDKPVCTDCNLFYITW